MTTTDRDALVAACVAADPGEATPLLVLADYLDDAGDGPTAHALRWMARHGKRPIQWEAGGRWNWMGSRRDYDRQIPARSRYRRRMPLTSCWLPRVVGAELCSRFTLASRGWLVAVKRLGWALHRIRELVD